MQFPYITVRNSGSQYEALCAVRLDSLLHSDLAVDLYRQGGERVVQQSNYSIVKPLQKTREALLAALTAWGFATTLEIRVTSIPDLKYRAQGKIDICLVLLCQAVSENDAKEILLSRYLSLINLLGVHSPEAHWKPVDSAEDFSAFFKPFTPTSAFSIHRKREKLMVSTPLYRNSIGFAKGKSFSRTEGATIDHLYPWLPSHDDWFRLLNTLTGQLDPIQLIIRLKPMAASSSLENLDKSIQKCE